MAVTLNASASAGLITTADTSTILQLQTGGTTAVTVDASQNVGIGTASPASDARLTLASPTTESYVMFSRTNSTFFDAAVGNNAGSLVFKGGADSATVAGLTEFMRIDTSGNVGIGTSSPSRKLVVSNSGAAGLEIDPFTRSATTGTSLLSYNRSTSAFVRADYDAEQHLFFTSTVERMRITSTGQVQQTNSDGNLINTIRGGRYGYSGSYQTVLIGTTSGSVTPCINVDPSGNAGGSFSGNGGEVMFRNQTTFITPNSGNTNYLTLLYLNNGNVQVFGALSKGSGSFRIDHPLPQLEKTHDLVHSFIEGPQADLIYRGKVSLVGGAASVNIDTSSGMTEGTFVLLNREVQCFTTNETGWVHVRGSVAGNVLTIEAQDNTCTDTISWMVIGERKDKHMYDTDWTDENGKVIVEPIKQARPPQAEEAE